MVKPHQNMTNQLVSEQQPALIPEQMSEKDSLEPTPVHLGTPGTEQQVLQALQKRQRRELTT